ncbi:hypothetical protein HN873_039856 [Arachis hypogaea]
MNVGQIFEWSLGLVGDMLDRHYRIAPFDERYEQEASRKLVFFELYEASKQTSNPWIFEPEYPDKSRIFDGRTENPFEQSVIIGKPYILKLIHQVDDKIHGRSCGHYALVTQQPLRGRAKQGGQNLAKMIYFGVLAPYCRVDLERYERSPPKPYIRLSSNTAFHRILYRSRNRLTNTINIYWRGSNESDNKYRSFKEATGIRLPLGVGYYERKLIMDHLKRIKLILPGSMPEWLIGTDCKFVGNMSTLVQI